MNQTPEQISNRLRILLEASRYRDLSGSLTVPPGRTTSRSALIAQARYAARTRPLLKNSTRIWLAFVVSTGFTISAKEGEPPEWATFARTVRSAENRSIFSLRGQRRTFKRLLNEGELYVAIFPGNPVRVRLLPSSNEITGFIKDPEDESKVLFYVRTHVPVTQKMSRDGVLHEDPAEPVVELYRAWDASDAEVRSVMGRIPVGLIVPRVTMLSLSMEEDEERSGPFLESVLPWDRAYTDFMDDRVNVSRAIAKYLWRLRGSVDQTTLTAVLQELTEGTQGAGAGFAAPEGVNLEPLHMSSGGRDAQPDARLIRQQIGAGVGITEPNLTGDPSVGNLASLTAMDSAMERNFILDQALLTNFYEDIFSATMVKEPRTIDSIERAMEWVETNVELGFPPVVAEDVEKRVAALMAAAPKLPESWLVRELLRTFGEKSPEKVEKEYATQNLGEQEG